MMADKMQKTMAKAERMIEVLINSFEWLVRMASGKAWRIVELVI